MLFKKKMKIIITINDLEKGLISIETKNGMLRANDMIALMETIKQHYVGFKPIQDEILKEWGVLVND